jgi:Tol biopolymer transport system component
MKRWLGGMVGSARDVGRMPGRSLGPARRSFVTKAALAAAVAAALIPAATASATGGVVTNLVSVSRSGGGGNRPSVAVAVTPDGRFVLFNSSASNLVAGDTNGTSDVFVRDIVSGRTHCVDLGPNRRQANADAVGTAISADGRFVVFTSTASNLTRVPDTNHVSDVYLRNRKTGRTVRVSVPNGGGQFATASLGGVVSDDGRWVAFTHIVNGDVWHTDLRDRLRHTTHPIDAGPVADNQPVGLSSDGRYILMLVEDHHGTPFEYRVRDHVASREQKVPMPPDDATVTGAIMTPDARYVAFSAFNTGSGGDDALRWRRGTAASKLLHGNNANRYDTDGISSDGRYFVYNSDDSTLVAGDTNGRFDVFRDDLTGAGTIRANLSATGVQLPKGGFDEPAGTDLQPIQGNLTTTDGSTVVFDTSSPAVPADTNTIGDVYIRGPL